MKETGPRRVYVYYRVQAADLVDAVQAARALQAQLRDRWPGLQAELLARPEAGSDDARTLMEVYALDAEPGGLDAPRQAAIEAAAAQALAPWLQGPRHVEVFTPCA